jgi:uncharacterized coiled-coil DUF342 family protein
MVDHLHKIRNAKLLVARLERLSADSPWAHKASGLRGSLLRSLERIEASQMSGSLNPEEEIYLSGLLEAGFAILKKAAKEITSLEDLE